MYLLSNLSDATNRNELTSRNHPGVLRSILNVQVEFVLGYIVCLYITVFFFICLSKSGTQ